MEYYTLKNQFGDLCDRYYPRLDRIRNVECLFRSLDNQHHNADHKITEEELQALWLYVQSRIGCYGLVESFNRWTYKWCDHCEKMVGTHIDNGDGEHVHCNGCGLPQESVSECGSSRDCGCCECFSCERCGGCHDSGCSNCRQCNNCCECVTCQNCHSITSDIDNFCFDCNNCTSCCDCNNSDADDDYRADRMKHFIPTIKTRKEFACTRLVGVEWEYNSVDYSSTPLREWTNRWEGAIQEDGSCGMEIVTPPLGGDYIRLALTDLAKSFKRAEAQVDSRCGIHVHVDARDLNWDDMYRLLKVYAKVEPLLYLIAGQHRISNTYCVPCGKEFMGAFNSSCGIKVSDGRSSTSKASKDAHKNNLANLKASIMRFPLGLSNVDETKEWQRFNSAKKSNGRYRGMNIAPWVAGRMRGHGSKIKKDATIEFRIHRHSLDAERVIGWSQLCAKMVDWAAKSSNKELEDLPRSQLRTLIKIAPECKKFILKRISDWRKACSYRAFETDEGVTRRLTFKQGKFLFKELPRYNYVGLLPAASTNAGLGYVQPLTRDWFYTTPLI